MSSWSRHWVYGFIPILLIGGVVIYLTVFPSTVLQPGALLAGEYSTAHFNPGFSFHVSEGWEVGPSGDTSSLLTFERENSGAVRFQNVAESNLTFYDNSGELGAEHTLGVSHLRDDPLNWHQFLSDHPNLDVESPRLVQVGGVDFVEYDIELSPVPSDYPQECRGPCVPLFHYTHFSTQGNDFLLSEGNKLRILATQEVGDEPLMIVISTTEQGFNRFINEAAEMLGSVKWDADVSNSAHSQVPNLVGKKGSTDVLTAAGDFTVQVSSIKVTDEPKGTIISQDPDPDSAAIGSTIWVDVSAGQPTNPGDIYEDDFSDTSSGWPSEPEGDGFSLGYSNNSYFISVEESGGPAVRLPESAPPPASSRLTDSIIEVDATSTIAEDRPNTHWGVTCRMEDGLKNGYLLAINGSGRPTISRYIDGVPTLLADDNELRASAIKRDTATLTGVSDSVIEEGTATNHIRADCIGDTLTLYVNGRRVAEAKDVEPTSGTMGITVQNTGDQPSGSEVFFDNFRISSTPPSVWRWTI